MPVKTELYDRTWLVKARARLGLTQAQAGEASGISAGFYNKIEQGIQVPTVKHAIAISEALNFDVKMFAREKKIG